MGAAAPFAVSRFSALQLLGLTAAFDIGLFLTCFLFFFFFIHPHHKPIPTHQPIMQTSVSSVGILGPRTQQGLSRFMGRLNSRFGILADTAMISSSSLGNASLRNYLNCLNCMGNIFCVISIPSLFFVLPLECFLGKNFEFGQNSLSTNFPLTDTGGRTSVWILYGLTWAYSYVALAEISDYCSRLQSCVVPQEACLKEVQSRTVFLRGIPIRERRDGSRWTGKKFKLRPRAVLKAENHLKDELNRQVESTEDNTPSMMNGNEEPAQVVSALHLVVTQDRIHDLHAYVCRFQRRYDHYSGIVSRKPRFKWYYEWRKRQYSKALDISRAQIEHLACEYEFAGLAVVTFAKKKHAEGLLQKSFFSFGMPPFASIGLPVKKAPYCDDVIWNNVHVSVWKRRLAKYTLTCLLFVLTVAFVAPVAIAQDLVPITDALKEYKDIVDITDTEFFVLTQYLPVVVILGTNSFVIPYAVYLISMAIRPQLKTDQEKMKLYLNLCFSVLTTVVIPLLGLDSIGALLKWLAQSKQVLRIQVLLGSVLLKSSGVFTLRYLINSAFLTSASQLLQCGQLSYQRLLLMFWAVTKEEKKEARTPWVFEWGYSYAFALTVMFQSMIFSVCVPLTAPLAAMYFKMKYFVDKYNMQYNVFEMANEFSHLSPAVVQVMINAVALMQFVMSGFFFVQLEEASSNNVSAASHVSSLQADSLRIINVNGSNSTIPSKATTVTSYLPYSEPTLSSDLPEMTSIVFGPFQFAAMPLLISSLCVFVWSFKKQHDVSRILEDVPILPPGAEPLLGAASMPNADSRAYCPPYRAQLHQPSVALPFLVKESVASSRPMAVTDTHAIAVTDARDMRPTSAISEGYKPPL